MQKTHLIIILVLVAILAIGVLFGVYISSTRPIPGVGITAQPVADKLIGNTVPAVTSPSQEEVSAERRQMNLDLKIKYTKGIFNVNVTDVSNSVISGDAVDDEEYDGKVMISVKTDEENGTLIVRQMCEGVLGCKRTMASLSDVSAGTRILVYLAYVEDGSVMMEGNAMVAQSVVIEE
ncbi:MAG: hypothetical protein GW815_03735 [Candidatus Moranbacteria bacterium]|nr:hypothetical protein [Candidatus Moranbacteria bacterium]PIV86302.1 MAG: hypothetical protein COW50_02210 [Candidatus Moranbacteria bacterium CG17_big_fil_post_rev_8_21_14_2_50_41_107]PIW94085.1 MAG: hypothetical protein COZ86_02915 [Candidatus Moranbacteria bacterium CG_4_8_14_3_um_filter_41_13]